MKKLGKALLGAGAAISEGQDALKSHIKAIIGQNKLTGQYSKDIPSRYYTEGRKKAIEDIKTSVKAGDNISARKRTLQQLGKIEKQALADGKPTSAEYARNKAKKYEKLIKGHGISIREF